MVIECGRRSASGVCGLIMSVIILLSFFDTPFCYVNMYLSTIVSSLSDPWIIYLFCFDAVRTRNTQTRHATLYKRQSI